MVHPFFLEISQISLTSRDTKLLRPKLPNLPSLRNLPTSPVVIWKSVLRSGPRTYRSCLFSRLQNSSRDQLVCNRLPSASIPQKALYSCPCQWWGRAWILLSQLCSMKEILGAGKGISRKYAHFVCILMPLFCHLASPSIPSQVSPA